MKRLGNQPCECTDAFIELSKHAKQSGIAVIAISANSVITHPQDGPEKMAEDARNLGVDAVAVRATSHNTSLQFAHADPYAQIILFTTCTMRLKRWLKHSRQHALQNFFWLTKI